jgi:DNA polymerase lambda
MEIIETGDLRRIGYEKTDDVEAINLFQGIYGVGMENARSLFVNLLICQHRPTNSSHVV